MELLVFVGPCSMGTSNPTYIISHVIYTRSLGWEMRCVRLGNGTLVFCFCSFCADSVLHNQQSRNVSSVRLVLPHNDVFGATRASLLMNLLSQFSASWKDFVMNQFLIYSEKKHTAVARLFTPDHPITTNHSLQLYSFTLRCQGQPPQQTANKKHALFHISAGTPTFPTS